MTAVPSKLGVRIERGDRSRPVSTVAVRGDVDMVTAPELKRMLTVQLSTSPRAVVVDLSAVSFMGVAGLRAPGQAFEAGAVRGIPVSLVVTSRVPGGGEGTSSGPVPGARPAVPGHRPGMRRGGVSV